MATTQLEKTEGRMERRRRFEWPFETIFDEMERLWSSPFGWQTRLLPAFARPTRWLPSVDVFEKEGQLVIRADLPGLKKEDIDVSVQEGNLIVRGERKEESRVEKEDYLRLERATGSFYRCLPLPSEVKPEEIKAEFKDGVLEIRLPKPAREEAEARKIPIS